MEKRHDKILSDFYDVIKKKLDISLLLPYLVKKKLLTKDEHEQLKNDTASREEKNNEFYHILKTKGARAFSLFLEALNEEKKHPGHRSLCSKLAKAEKFCPTVVEKASSTVEPVVHYDSDHETRLLRQEECVSTVSLLSNSSSHSASSATSAHTVVASQDTSPSQLTLAISQHFESLMDTLSEQFATFQAEIDKGAKNLEKKVEKHHLSITGKGISLWYHTVSTGNSSNNSEKSSLVSCQLSTTNSSPSAYSPESSGVYKKDSLDNLPAIGTQYLSNSPKGKTQSKQHSDDCDSDYERLTVNFPKLENATRKRKEKVQYSGDCDVLSLPPLAKKKPFEYLSYPPTIHSVFEIPCICQQSKLLPLIQADKLHLHFASQKSSADSRVHDTLEHIRTYSLFDGCPQESDEKCLNNRKQDVCPTMFCYSKKITILGGEVDSAKILKLGLYQVPLEKKTKPYSWKLIIPSMFRISIARLDLKNSVSVVNDKDEVIVVSVLNHSVRKTSRCHYIVVYLFLPSEAFGNHWKWAKLKCPQASSLGNGKCMIQSCAVISHYLYCSLLFENSGLLLVKIDLDNINFIPPQENSHNIRGRTMCYEYDLFKEPSLDNCFLSVQSNFIIVTTFKVCGDKTVMEIRQYSDQLRLLSSCQLPFQSIVKVVSASLAPDVQGLIVVVYHNDSANSCYVKKVNVHIHM